MTALIACIYILLRRGNAFAPDVTPPVILRRWAAAFYAEAFLGHIWWFLYSVYCNDTSSVYCLVVAVTDNVLLLTTIAGTLLSMLQDRKRPVWPVLMAVIPYVVLMVIHIIIPDGRFLDIAVAYILLFYVQFSIYMVFAVRQYGRWLRDNYADLEHKEVWVSQVLVVVILILILSDGFSMGNLVISYILQLIQFPFFGLLLWRIETLPQLDGRLMAEPLSQMEEILVEQVCSPALQTSEEADLPILEQQSLAITNIEQLLAERCMDTQLYLQHDLTLLQLAQAVGTNRLYLSQYFSRQGTTYNAYINDLRINHFISHYQEAVQNRPSVTAQQLASDSGYRSYSTFSLAFKQRMGQSVTAWMRETDK